MPIGDWIREANERRRQRLREEGYLKGYEDGRQGKPPRPQGDSGKGAQDATDPNDSKR